MAGSVFVLAAVLETISNSPRSYATNHTGTAHSATQSDSSRCLHLARKKNIRWSRLATEQLRDNDERAYLRELGMVRRQWDC